MRTILAALLLAYVQCAFAQGISAPAILMGASAPATYTFAVDAVSTVNEAGESSLSWSHTVTASQGNRAVFMLIGYESGSANVTSSTYAGSALTQVGFTRGVGEECVAIYRLLNPATGANTAAVTLSGVPCCGLKAAVISFTGVNQTAPTGTYASNSDWWSDTPTVNVSSATGDIVIDVASTNGEWHIATGAGQTLRFNLETGTCVFGSTESGASTVTSSYTVVSATEWCIGAVSVKPN